MRKFATNWLLRITDQYNGARITAKYRSNQPASPSEYRIFAQSMKRLINVRKQAHGHVYTPLRQATISRKYFPETQSIRLTALIPYATRKEHVNPDFVRRAHEYMIAHPIGGCFSPPPELEAVNLGQVPPIEPAPACFLPLVGSSLSTPPPVSLQSKEALLDFFSEGDFESYSRTFRQSQRRANRLFSRSLQSGISEDGKINKALDRARLCTRVIYALFAEGLGVRDSKFPIGTVDFSKSEYDEAMERCFGSLETQPTFEFQVRGIIPLKATKKLHSERIFSLYLLRKVLCVADPREIPIKDRQFLQRISADPPPPPSVLFLSFPQLPLELSIEISSYLDEFVIADRVMERLCALLFTKKSAQKYPRSSFIPNSGKACTERTLKEGGKRAALYLSGDSFRPVNDYATIVSGGKYRTISLDSARNLQDYGFLNDYMFSIIRKLPCMISGRSVEDWLQDVKIPEGSWILSGDLKDATDNFRSRLAEIVIRHLADLFFPRDSDLHFERMCAFTTRAVFNVTVQTIGQLMGSILSFPILGLINLTSQLIMHLGPERAICIMTDELYEFRRCGINGDDLVTWDEERDRLAQRWLSVLPWVGGVASPGKSLLSKRFMTVNSEMYKASSKKNSPFLKLKKCKVLRPSLIVALHEGAYKAPQESWSEYLTSPLRSPSADRIFRPRRVIFPHFPVSWGGLGSEVQTFENFDFVSACYLKAAKTRVFEGFQEMECVAPGVHRVDNKFTVYLGGEAPSWDQFDKVSGYVEKSYAKAVGKKVYGVKKMAYWTTPISRRKTVEMIMDEVQDLYESLTPYKKEMMFKEYQEAVLWEQRGYVYVRGMVDLGEQKVYAPKFAGQFMTRPPISVRRTLESVEFEVPDAIEHTVDEEEERWLLRHPEVAEARFQGALEAAWGGEFGLDGPEFSFSNLAGLEELVSI